MVLRDYRTRCINSTGGYNVKLIRWLFQLVAFAGWYSQRRAPRDRRRKEREGMGDRATRRQREDEQLRRTRLGIVNFRCNAASLLAYKYLEWIIGRFAYPPGWIYSVQPRLHSLFLSLSLSLSLSPTATSGVSLRRQHYVLHILSPPRRAVDLQSCNTLSFKRISGRRACSRSRRRDQPCYRLKL